MTREDLEASLANNRPYFGSEMLSSRLTPVQRGVVEQIVEKVFSTSSGEFRMIDLGSGAGETTFLFAQGLRDHAPKGGRVLCLDTWRDAEVFRLFLHNLRAAGFERDVSYRLGRPEESLSCFQDASFDVVYFDAARFVREAQFYLHQAKRVVTTGGFVAGNACDLQGELKPEMNRLLIQAFGQSVPQEGLWVYRREGEGFVPQAL